MNAADIMHTACYVQLQEIYRNAALRSQRTSHTIQMKDDQHRGTGFFLDREHIRQNIDDIVIS